MQIKDTYGDTLDLTFNHDRVYIMIEEKNEGQHHHAEVALDFASARTLAEAILAAMKNA